MHDLPASRRRAATGLLAVLATIATMVATAAPAGASHDVTPARIQGANQYETAAEIARFAHPEGSGVALLANGTNFPDALAATALSRPTIAPILLSTRDSVPLSTIEAMDALGVQEVVIMGGTAAISEDVENALAQDRTVKRIAGDDRYATAYQAAQSISASPNAAIGSIEGRRTAIVVNGVAFPDAISAGPLAAGQENPFPILLTLRDSVHPTTSAALTDFAIEHVIIVGGTAAVSDAVQQSLEADGMAVTRLGGENRSETATFVADYAALALGFDASLVNLARGDFFADALAAGPYAGRVGAPILLTQTPNILAPSNEAWLAGKCAEVSVIRALGGTAAVTASTLEAAEQAAENCPQTYLVSPMEPASTTAGERLEAGVIGRSDDEPFTGPVDVALFPCANADILGAGGDTFADADADGAADGLGRTDTDSAAIVDVNGQVITPAGEFRDAEPGADGLLEVGLRADAADCAVFVVFDDTDADGHLDVDASGHPVEPYGVAQFSWTA